MSTKLPRAALLITHKIADFDRWYKGFQAHEQARRDNGILGHHVNLMRGENTVSVYLAVGDLEAAKEFARSPSLKSAMAEAGVKGKPDLAWMKPRSENIVWDRELPAIIVRHEVKNYLEWRKIYEVAEAIRNKNGIIGHATNTALGNENDVIVYHQAEKFATLEKFLADPELKDAMELGGVIKGPEVFFATGGWAKMYTRPEFSPEDRKRTDTTAHA